MKKLAFLLVLFSAFLFCANAAAKDCVTKFGRTVCGYNCIAEYGQIKCSQDRNGRCIAKYGQIVCVDPPRGVRERPECIAEYGRIECGYNCAAAHGEVRCGKTPDSYCQAQGGAIVCRDRRDNHKGPHNNHMTPAHKPSHGPGSHYGHGPNHGPGPIHGPGPKPKPHVTPPPPKPKQSCINFKGGKVCGYDCKRTNNDVNCARTPRGRCSIRGNKVVCND